MNFDEAMRAAEVIDAFFDEIAVTGFMVVDRTGKPVTNAQLGRARAEALHVALHSDAPLEPGSDGGLNGVTKLALDLISIEIVAHEEDEHRGESCIHERVNVLAYAAHRLGLDFSNLAVGDLFAQRLLDYGAVHDEHNADGHHTHDGDGHVH